MDHNGELIAFVVAVSWTACAVFAEIATKRLGTLSTNVLRMGFSVILLALALFIVTGSPLPQGVNTEVVMWFGASGIMGYVFGDYCLYKSYTLIGSRFGQLLLTTSSLFAAVVGFLMLGEVISLTSVCGIVVTLGGISISVLSKDRCSSKVNLTLSPKGVMLGFGAALGQGVGLVLSKMGMEAYQTNLASGQGAEMMMMPFAGTLMRSVIGFGGFVFLLIVSGQWTSFKVAVQDRVGVAYSVLVAIFGPFIGVTLSLLAVCYTSTGIAQTIMSTTPVLILVPAYFLFHQRIRLIEVIGAVISVIGVIILVL